MKDCEGQDGEELKGQASMAVKLALPNLLSSPSLLGKYPTTQGPPRFLSQSFYCVVLDVKDNYLIVLV